MKAWTDYPFEWLGDTANKKAPIREINVLEYDDNKYCRVKVITDEHITEPSWGINKTDSIKSGYIYQQQGRCGEVPLITREQLKSLVA